MKNSILQPNWVKSTKSTRFHQLQPYFVDKDVLDIGCAVGYHKTDWMHGNIKVVAKNLYGIDLDRGAIEIIKEKGYNVDFGDAQNFDLGRKFNFIHAGELIEHLDNPGGFLKSVYKHLEEDGEVLITTPNGLRVNNVIYASTGGLKVNAEHTCWFCEYTLRTLFERMGFEIVEVGYLKHETFGVFRKIMLKLRTALLPDRVAWNTVYVVAKKKA